MRENAERCGAQVVMVQDDWGKAIDLSKVEKALNQNSDAKILAFVHAETSTGVRSDAEGLCALAKKFDCLSIVDAVTSLGGIEVNVDDWGIDAIYSGTQKCLSCVPGISPVSFSEKAAHNIKSRKSPVQSWFLDMCLVMGYWSTQSKRSYHHTAPVNSLYALHESLLILQEEGLFNSWSMHKLHHEALVVGLEALWLSFVVQPEDRLPQLNLVRFPEGINENAARQFLLENYNLEIGSGLGPLAGNVWRIGLMGFGSNKKNVLLCLSAIGSALRAQGGQLDLPAALQ